MERTHRHVPVHPRKVRRPGFNPCCDGTDSSTSPPTSGGGSRRCFNPCCDGTDSSTITSSAQTESTASSFNPCCDGTDSSTRREPGDDDPTDRVSILVVMERTHRPRHDHRLLRHHRVSILVVMERTHRPARTGGPPQGLHHVSILVVMERTHRRLTRPWTPPSTSCFNPCCDGTDSSTTQVCAALARYGEVSILVVMERTHRHPGSGQTRTGQGCFNPCCDGTDSSTRPSPSLTPPDSCFNPCCDGTDSSTPPLGWGPWRRGRCFNPCCDG